MVLDILSKVEKIRSAANKKHASAAYDETIADSSNTPAIARLSVNFSNSVTNAAHMLTLAEKRLLMVAVSKIDSLKHYPTGIIPPLSVSAAEYSSLYNINLSSAYTEMAKAAEKLMGRKINILNKSGKRDVLNWVGRATYHEREGWVEIAFFHELTPYLSHLKGKYTSYKLQQASALRSIYAWRLLELLTQFKDTGWRTDKKIDDFILAIGARETYAKNFASLRRWVIEPAVKELQEKEGWVIDWQTINKGRKVTGLRFKFTCGSKSHAIEDVQVREVAELACELPEFYFPEEKNGGQVDDRGVAVSSTPTFPFPPDWEDWND